MKEGKGKRYRPAVWKHCVGPRKGEAECLKVHRVFPTKSRGGKKVRQSCLRILKQTSLVVCYGKISHWTSTYMKLSGRRSRRAIKRQVLLVSFIKKP